MEDSCILVPDLWVSVLWHSILLEVFLVVHTDAITGRRPPPVD